MIVCDNYSKLGKRNAGSIQEMKERSGCTTASFTVSFINTSQENVFMC
jgi:hypothetical protein